MATNQEQVARVEERSSLRRFYRESQIAAEQREAEIARREARTEAGVDLAAELARLQQESAELDREIARLKEAGGRPATEGNMDIDNIRPGASQEDLMAAAAEINAAMKAAGGGGEPVERPSRPNLRGLSQAAAEKALREFEVASTAYGEFLLAKQTLSPSEAAWLAGAVRAWHEAGRP